MKTFIFYDKHSSSVMSISADDFEEAKKDLDATLIVSASWRCDNEEGEEQE